MNKIVLLSGARPNFMKIFPLWRALSAKPDEFEPILIHTGQHYDRIMSDAIFEDLELPEPAYRLGVGSGSHGEQTARVMLGLEPILREEQPDWTVVVGDVNSTLAGAIVASKLGLKLAHVEAGLRSFDRTMPEEINRILTDSISDKLFTSCPDGDANLKAEGVPEERIRFVGNIMIDSLMLTLPKAQKSDLGSRLKIEAGNYVAVTLHRPSNVDDPERLQTILHALQKIHADTPVVFPVHPRTRERCRALGAELEGMIDPLSYVDFLNLVSNARAVITDSGGIQEETSFLGIPCLTLRPNTERPVTIQEGTNQLVPDSLDTLPESLRAAVASRPETPPAIDLWDGKTAGRIVAELRS